MAAVTAAIAAAGLGISAYGAYQQYQGAQDQAEAQRNMIQSQLQINQYEQQQEALRRQSMELTAQRQKMEVIRQQQRANSLALQRATNQGANLGSGLQGGYGQISGYTGFNLVGINQNLQLGRQNFDINALISQQNALISGQKINMANAGSDIAFGVGLSHLGGSLMSNASTFGGLYKDVSANMPGKSFYQSGPWNLGY